jgi:hypothetical protein
MSALQARTLLGVGEINLASIELLPHLPVLLADKGEHFDAVNRSCGEAECIGVRRGGCRSCDG